MSATLLVALGGPMQSWGTRSRFQERDTNIEPSKSGLIGLLCAALGRDRAEPVDDLASLQMGVRVDAEGVPAKDYHTTQDVVTADGKKRTPSISNRWYLADAVFLAALQGPKGVLEKAQTALAHPKWPLFLGRKSFVPSLPLFLKDGLQPDWDMWQALAAYPLLLTQDRVQRRLRQIDSGRDVGRVRVVVDSQQPTHETRHDIPVSYGWESREYRERFVSTQYMDFTTLKENGVWKCI